jgi:hypothetical protein
MLQLQIDNLKKLEPYVAHHWLMEVRVEIGCDLL